MNRISKLKERLMIRRWLKNHSTPPSSNKPLGPRGVILGMRGESKLPDASGHDLASEVEETVLSCLMEEPRTDFIFPLGALNKRMFRESRSILEEVLKKMESQRTIKMEETIEGEIGVKLTLEGAMRVLFGNWFSDYVPERTSTRNGEQRKHSPTPIAH